MRQARRPKVHDTDENSNESLPSPIFPQGSDKLNPNTLSRKPSKNNRNLRLNPTTKGVSPTYQQTILENGNGLEPSAAANAASGHLTKTINGGVSTSASPNLPSPNLPSPTSHSIYNVQSTPAGRAYGSASIERGNPMNNLPDRSQSLGSNTNFVDPSYTYSSSSSTLVNDNASYRSTPTPTPPGRHGPSHHNDTPPSGGREPAVEIFKSFRVTMEDPCYKVLPAALKKYGINADPSQYALYIVYGDQERCLGRDEKPLILFKQLDKEGRKPMFMLRKQNTPLEGHTSSVNGSGYGMGRSGMTSQIQLPGGVL